MTSEIRTRFAPSPTGDLHLGNLRMAAFNYLFARRFGGAFVLRIEDTDSDRNVPGGVEGILADLAWAGLDWDEGPDREGPYGPYLQSERADGHRARAATLLEEGRAYLCFCRDEHQEGARDGERSGPGCAGGCRDLRRERSEARRRAGESPTLRFAIPEGTVRVEDAIRGTVTFPAADVGDFVILRSDGRPTYNFAVAVDDLEMRISHVIRGAGHLPNTPKHALLFDAFGAPRPIFAHLPTILGEDGTKLSKRNGSPGVSQLRALGFPPDGVLNYLSLLGWSPGDDREILTREELVREIDLERARPSDAMFDPDKLRWVAGRHIAGMPLDDLVSAVEPFIDRVRFQMPNESIPSLVGVLRTRLQTYAEVNDHIPLVFASEEVLRAGRSALSRFPDGARLLARIRDGLAGIEPWTGAEAVQVIREVGRSENARGPDLYHPIRLALTGTETGPDLGLILAALGRSLTVALLDAAQGGAPN